MEIDLPDFVPPAETPALVVRNRTDVVDVYRHYDVNKAERIEPAVSEDTLPAPLELA